MKSYDDWKLEAPENESEYSRDDFEWDNADHQRDINSDVKEMKREEQYRALRTYKFNVIRMSLQYGKGF